MIRSCPVLLEGGDEMKEATKTKCDAVVELMLWQKVGIKKACEEYNISVGSVHNYIHNILRYDDDEKYRLIMHDMNKRYKKGR